MGFLFLLFPLPFLIPIPSTIPILRFKGVVNNASACYVRPFKNAPMLPHRRRERGKGSCAFEERNPEEGEKPRDSWRG